MCHLKLSCTKLFFYIKTVIKDESSVTIHKDFYLGTVAE